MRTNEHPYFLANSSRNATLRWPDEMMHERKVQPREYALREDNLPWLQDDYDNVADVVNKSQSQVVLYRRYSIQYR